MHLKGYCVDHRLLRTGSANFSRSGETRQDNGLVALRGVSASAGLTPSSIALGAGAEISATKGLDGRAKPLRVIFLQTNQKPHIFGRCMLNSLLSKEVLIPLKYGIVVKSKKIIQLVRQFRHCHRLLAHGFRFHVQKKLLAK